MRTFLATLAILTAFPAAPAGAVDLRAYERPEARAAIARITREAVAARLAGRRHHPGPVPPALTAPAGVFVTFTRDGVTRGCWGAVAPRAGRLADELADAAGKALTLDRRQRPIRKGDLPGLVAHVSIVGDLEPVADPAALLPRRHGLFVAGPGKGGVLLPGEAATAAWQVATCRRKAGLARGERARMYRFETAVIGPIALDGALPR
jgi:AMMECR1 domain-containing protein